MFRNRKQNDLPEISMPEDDNLETPDLDLIRKTVSQEKTDSGSPKRMPEESGHAERNPKESGPVKKIPEEHVPARKDSGRSQKKSTSGTRRKRRSENREIAVSAYFFVFLFVLMIGYFFYFQIWKSEEFINSPYNTLSSLFDERVSRGKIISSDGKVLAETVFDEEGEEERVYPFGNVFAHVTGYAVNGKAGLESIADFQLLRSHEFFVDQIMDDVTGTKLEGDSVVTSIDYDLQTTAYEALNGYEGAIIAIDPSTGQILCMVSSPSYDPNTVEENWDTINSDGSSVLFNRATQGLYAPGSTFKILTLLEYYRENSDDYEDYTFDCTGSFTEGNQTIHCASGHAHGEETLKTSFANSCNSSFANIGLTLDAEKFADLCDSLLFNKKLPVSFVSGQSVFSMTEESGTGVRMQTAIGQGDTLVSPLHLAMICSAICNNGVLMKPYLVLKSENNAGITVTENKPEEYGKILTSAECAFLQEYMASVVKEGTGTKLAGQSYTVYGKTGTAQTSQSLDETNALFTGYARKGGRSIAIAVVVEDSGAGSTYAVPAAKAVFDAYFSD